MDLKMAAVYVADVLNNDVPIGEHEEVIKEFLKDLCELTKRDVEILPME